MEKTLGPQVGKYLRGLHERNGVVFHLQQSVAAIDERKVTLKDSQAIEAGARIYSDVEVVADGALPVTARMTSLTPSGSI